MEHQRVVEAPEESREGFACARGGKDQGALAAGNDRPAQPLRSGGASKTARNHSAVTGWKQAKDRSPGSWVDVTGEIWLELRQCQVCRIGMRAEASVPWTQ